MVPYKVVKEMFPEPIFSKSLKRRFMRLNNVDIPTVNALHVYFRLCYTNHEMLNIPAYIFGSIAAGFIIESFLLSVLYGLSNHFVLLPYRLFGFSGYGIPAPASAQLSMMVIFCVPYVVATLLVSYFTRFYSLKWFALSIALTNLITYVSQILLFSDLNDIIYMPTFIIGHALGFFLIMIYMFLPLAFIIVLLASLVRWASQYKFEHNTPKLQKSAI